MMNLDNGIELNNLSKAKMAWVRVRNALYAELVNISGDRFINFDITMKITVVNLMFVN